MISYYFYSLRLLKQSYILPIKLKDIYFCKKPLGQNLLTLMTKRPHLFRHLCYQRISNIIRLQPEDMKQISCKWSYLEKKWQLFRKKTVSSEEEISRWNLYCVLYRLQDKFIIYIDNKDLCITSATSTDLENSHRRLKAFMNPNGISTVLCDGLEVKEG